MSATKKRHDTLRAIVRGSPLYLQIAEFAQIEAELEELSNCNRIGPERRKRLLQVLHSTRALDSTLGKLISHYGQVPETSLGPRLSQLKNLPSGQRGHLSHATIDAFRRAICSKRNKFVHTANAYPTSSNEVDGLVGDIQSVLTALL